MADPIIFTITEAGKQAALQAIGDDTKILIDLDYVAVGTSKYTPTGDELAMGNEFTRANIVSEDVMDNTLRFSSTIYAGEIVQVYELGIFTTSGVLFAIAASETEPLVTLYPDISFVTSFGLAIDDMNVDNINVSIDTNSGVANVLMANHVAADNPHPQYVDLTRFQFLLEVMFPVGYLYHTNSEANPKPEFDELLGISTSWRRLAGKIIVATDPDDDYIKDVGLTLGQKGMTTLAGDDQRPHVYPLYTKNIFERYNPDDVIETVWNINSDKASINEGESVRFVVTANNIPDGQIINWSINEGELNSANNDIPTPDKSESGTVIIKNGSASIYFTTTPDDNAEEPQKHVRLTLGAPANISINVPVNDAGNNEIALHITESTLDGIELDEYYKKHSGDYLAVSSKVRFIVDAGVDIIAPDTNTPAIIDGTNWPIGTRIVIENYGRILGRGGDGGMGAVLVRKALYETTFVYSDTAESGTDGGTAIKSISNSISVENYNIVAGGGGGGGGGGAYVYDYSSSDQRVGHQNGTAAGGGAPLGKASINAGSFEWYMADDRNDNRDLITDNMDVDNPFALFSGLVFSGSSVSSAKIKLDALYFSGAVSVGSANLRSDFKDVPLWVPYARQATKDSTLYKKYKSQIEDDPDNRVFFQKIWSDSSSEIYNLSTVCKRATDASIDKAGLGGYSVGIYSDTRGVYQGDDGGDISSNSGGAGGELGEDGQTFDMSSYTVRDNKSSAKTQTYDKSDLSSSRSHELAPASGGKAGKIYEGSVTISNYSSGISKGR